MTTDDEFPKDDPGNVLRREIAQSNVWSSDLRKYSELFHTAYERGLLSFNPGDELHTMLKIVAIARDSSPEKIESMRM